MTSGRAACWEIGQKPEGAHQLWNKDSNSGAKAPHLHHDWGRATRSLSCFWGSAGSRDPPEGAVDTCRDPSSRCRNVLPSRTLRQIRKNASRARLDAAFKVCCRDQKQPSDHLLYWFKTVFNFYPTLIFLHFIFTWSVSHLIFLIIIKTEINTFKTFI